MLGGLPAAAPASPVLPGDHPDPSLMRTGDGWYATSTSDDWLPAFPLLHSRDLVHWRQVGSVLMERPRWAATDFWAPDIVRRGGRVLVYYAARARDGRRCIAVASADRARGPYIDNGPLLCTRVGEIDPLPVRDEHGADWLLWKRDGNSRDRATPILAAPLAPGGLSLAAPPRELFRADAPWERELIEAPALLRRGGSFYLFYSARRCCGLHCNYATGVARAPALLGPWEKRPEPLLEGGATLRCPGHAGVTEGLAGEPLLAYHAYVRGDPAQRRLIVAPLGFDAAGWPVVRPQTGPVAKPAAQSFRFDRPLGTGWEWPSGPRPSTHVAAGRLALGRGALARRADTSTFTARAKLVSRRPGSRPGLAVMASGDAGVGVELREGHAVAWRLEDGRRTEAGSIELPAGRPLGLRVTMGNSVRVAVRGGGTWQAVGGPQPLPSWSSGPRVALTVAGRGRAGVDLGPALAEFGALLIRPR